MNGKGSHGVQGSRDVTHLSPGVQTLAAGMIVMRTWWLKHQALVVKSLLNQLSDGLDWEQKAPSAFCHAEQCVGKGSCHQVLSLDLD